jgi:hypothetical protein
MAVLHETDGKVRYCGSAIYGESLFHQDYSLGFYVFARRMASTL